MKPKYMVIYDSLFEKLESKEYDSGDMLPSELELCDIYHASRMTVNKVIQMLSQEGRVKRIRGKGTFVLEPQVDKDIVKLTSFTEDMKSIGKNPGSKLISYSMNFDVDSKISNRLELADDDFVHIIRRIRTADGEPIALDVDRVSSKLTKTLDLEQVNESLYSYIENTLKIQIDHSEYRVKSIVADETIAKYLNVDIGSPVLYMRHISFTKDGLPFEYCKTYYPADKYSLTIKAYR